MESSVGPYSAAPDSAMTDTKSTSTAPAEGEPTSQHEGDNVAATADAAPTTGRSSEGSRSTSGNRRRRAGNPPNDSLVLSQRHPDGSRTPGQEEALGQQQANQPQFFQQQQFDPRAGALPEKKKSVYFASSEAPGEMAARVPGEGSSIRSFQSRTSNDVGSGEASVEDNRSMLSSNTNMGTPLLRPLLPERATRTATKDKMEHLCLAVNVILFSVLAGVVAAFIVQQVTHAM
ncbi:hypothetical protein MTO96_045465 [Rhipicephalus appendiculatus]